MPFTLHRAAASTKAKRIGSLVTPMAASKGRRGGLIDLTVDGLETIDLTKDYPSDLSQLSDFDGLTNNVSFYDQPHAPSPPSPATLQLDLTSLHVVDEVVKLEPTQALAASRLAWIMSTNEETIKHILATHKPQDWDQLETSCAPTNNQLHIIRDALQESDCMGAASLVQNHQVFANVSAVKIRYWTWKESLGKGRAPEFPALPTPEAVSRKKRVDYTPQENETIMHVAKTLNTNNYLAIANDIIQHNRLPGRSSDQIYSACYNRFQRSAQRPATAPRRREPPTSPARFAGRGSRGADGILRAKLLSLRRELMNQHGYTDVWFVFTNETLKQLVEQKPRNVDSLMRIRHIKQGKANLFGDEVLGIINSHCERHGI